MVLADAEDVEADLVGQLDLLNQVAQPLSSADHLAAAGIGRDLAERIDPELHRHSGCRHLFYHRRELVHLADHDGADAKLVAQSPELLDECIDGADEDVRGLE